MDVRWCPLRGHLRDRASWIPGTGEMVPHSSLAAEPYFPTYWSRSGKSSNQLELRASKLSPVGIGRTCHLLRCYVSKIPLVQDTTRRRCHLVQDVTCSRYHSSTYETVTRRGFERQVLPFLRLSSACTVDVLVMRVLCGACL